MKIKRTGGHVICTVKNETTVPFLSFPMLEDTGVTVHGFSTRLGGVSSDHLTSMNLSFSRGDKEENVRENFRRIGESIGFSCENLVFSDQTHTTNVRVITVEDRGKGFVKQRDYSDIDGMITNVPGLVLSTFYADCVPLFFVDPVKKAIGLSHSGWKGTVGKIGRITVEKMTAEYGSDPKDIFAAIGPSICQDCYEVSEDVILQFRENYDPALWDSLFYKKANGKYQLNLWKANESVFLEAGIIKEHISITDICTCCNPEILYSHRASQGKRGNLAAFLALKTVPKQL
ncbi:peptidoglycan editing factor PgeF [Robinsoniella peoriensis]|uniref:peptidoglycan editing factor PgeF n=1 Tax=Robinsoniella peoriensis TaxID=180332 RepID=UPI00085C27A0|nr:peptidoglycan editing factor PgeF [Robinsoniella peoriensis]